MEVVAAMKGGRIGRSLDLAAAALAAGLLACESPTPPASLPPLPPPPPPLPPPPPPPQPPPNPDLGDVRTSAECRNVSVRAEPPERVYEPDYHNTCDPTLTVAFSVEAENGDAMIMEFFRRYAVSDWRVRRSGSGFRHDVRIPWNIRRSGARSSLPRVWPLVIPACPEGGAGPVLACTDVSCEVVASEKEVRPFVPSWIDVELAVPSGYPTIPDLRNGETLSIPVRYTAYRDARLEVRLDSPSSNLRLLEPRTQDLGALRAGDSGTLIFRVMGEWQDGWRDEAVAGVWFNTTTPGGACVLHAREVRIRVRR